MTASDYVTAASILRKYARAVESKLYMNMKIPEAHEAIAEALRLAKFLEAIAEEKMK